MENEALGFEITELRLGLPGDSSSSVEKNGKKRVFSEIAEDENSTSSDGKSQMKDRVVGWPPIGSYRKKNNFNYQNGPEVSKFYVKVSMDGAPFLRKIDLNVYTGYTDLSLGFEKLFHGLHIGAWSWKDSKGSEYVQIYQDKDGDWMLVGDVPWEMFTGSCRRLRIMKRSDSTGLELPVRRETHTETEG